MKKTLIFTIIILLLGSMLTFGLCGGSAGFIKIDYPTGDVWWETGSEYTIEFQTSEDVTGVNIKLYKGGSEDSVIAENVDPADGEYDYTPPTSLADGDDYTIYMESVDDANVNVESDPIHIRADIPPTYVNLTWSADAGLLTYGMYIFETGTCDIMDNGDGTYSLDSSVDGNPWGTNVVLLQPDDVEGIALGETSPDLEVPDPQIVDIVLIGDDDYTDDSISVFTMTDANLEVSLTAPGTYAIEAIVEDQLVVPDITYSEPK
jgi:hypothetical protein